MIPKVIHYCWFGGNPLPYEVKKCIKSWEKMCPDYDSEDAQISYKLMKIGYVRVGEDSIPVKITNGLTTGLPAGCPY